MLSAVANSSVGGIIKSLFGYDSSIPLSHTNNQRETVVCISSFVSNFTHF